MSARAEFELLEQRKREDAAIKRRELSRLRDVLTAVGYAAELAEHDVHRFVVRLILPDGRQTAITIRCEHVDGRWRFGAFRAWSLGLVEDVEQIPEVFARFGYPPPDWHMAVRGGEA